MTESQRGTYCINDNNGLYDDVLYVDGDAFGTKEIWRIYHLTYSVEHENGYSLFQEFDSRKAVAV